MLCYTAYLWCVCMTYFIQNIERLCIHNINRTDILIRTYLSPEQSNSPEWVSNVLCIAMCYLDVWRRVSACSDTKLMKKLVLSVKACLQWKRAEVLLYNKPAFPKALVVLLESRMPCINWTKRWISTCSDTSLIEKSYYLLQFSINLLRKCWDLYDLIFFSILSVNEANIS